MAPIWKTFIGLSLVYWIADRDPNSVFKLAIVEPLGRICDIIPQLTRPKLSQSVLDNQEAYMTTAEIIRHRGYPLEIHHVVTEDGYILELHRIPFAAGNGHLTNSTKQRRPVFLQHGLMASNHVWLINPTNHSLAYLLADQGYDVWMGNSRGNSNSRKHLFLDPTKEDYWNYTWDEMGRYDIPASIGYVLNVTGQEKLAGYVGHSLGCTLFFIGAIHQPKLNDQVEVMIGLGPTSSMNNLRNVFGYLGKFVRPYHLLLRMTTTSVLHPNDGLSNHLLRLFCETSQLGEAVCTRLLFNIFGHSLSYHTSTLRTIIGHYPDGGSIGAMIQFLQNSNSGEKFHRFDYGREENMKRYGSPGPAEYDLSLVTAPVYLISGDADPIAPPEDVDWLAGKLGNLKASIQVDSPFSHGDFIWSTRATELVHRPLINLLPSPYLNVSSKTTKQGRCKGSRTNPYASSWNVEKTIKYPMWTDIEPRTTSISGLDEMMLSTE